MGARKRGLDGKRMRPAIEDKCLDGTVDACYSIGVKSLMRAAIEVKHE
jgi:hypothetical protein